MAGERDDNPQKWRFDIPPDRVDLYLELKENPRALTAEEAEMMVELVDAWRGHEHRKHIALIDVLAQLAETN
jgi:hypothetical protein